MGFQLSKEHAGMIAAIAKSTGKTPGDAICHAIETTHRAIHGAPKEAAASDDGNAPAPPPQHPSESRGGDASKNSIAAHDDPAAAKRAALKPLEAHGEPDDGKPEDRSTEHQDAPRAKNGKPNPLKMWAKTATKDAEADDEEEDDDAETQAKKKPKAKKK